MGVMDWYSHSGEQTLRFITFKIQKPMTQQFLFGYLSLKKHTGVQEGIHKNILYKQSVKV